MIKNSKKLNEYRTEIEFLQKRLELLRDATRQDASKEFVLAPDCIRRATQEIQDAYKHIKTFIKDGEEYI